MDLKQYEAVKFELADILRKAVDSQIRTSGVFMDRKARDLFVRLAEDRFNIVMVGRFSRGKTSLMNAILGMDRLPTGIVPITSVITTIAYGTTENVVLEFTESRLPMDIRLDQLWEYITERGNPGNRRRIARAEIQLPAEILRRGFHFVDTPGLGSSIAANTRTTQDFMPEADAIVLVTSFDSPLSEEEFDLLGQLQRSGIQVFIVINKQDAASPEQRVEAMDYLRTRVSAFSSQMQAHIFPTSATEALAAKLYGNPELLQQSGLPVLEQALVDFVTTKKQSEFLRLTIARLAGFLKDIQASSELIGRLDALRGIRTPNAFPPLSAAVRPSVTTSVPQPTACPACVAADDAIFQYIAKCQRSLCYDQATQEHLASVGGFCGLHTWQLRSNASQLAICMGFPTVIERYVRDIRSFLEEKQRPACEAVAVLPEGPQECAICAVAAKAVTKAILDLKDRPMGPAAWCLPHLRQYACLQSDDEALRSRLARQADQLERVAEDMRRFALKRDGLRRDLASAEERAAADVGLRILVGDPNVVTWWRQQPG